MELKNAVAVCLISLFSATLVVLIARSLDSQAAARLEPQLARIVEELEAIRKQGGIAASPRPAAGGEAGADGLVVYYFHGNTRCPTCQSIESQAKQVVQTDFAPQVARGELVWKVLNYEQPANADLAKSFDIQAPVVVLARLKDGKIEAWNRLDEVWALVGDKPAYARFLRDQIARMLAADSGATVAQSGAAGKQSGPGPSGKPSDGAAPKPAADQQPLDLPVP